ncbi:MAG: YdbL family protein [Proteobacteria bacterium]|nr:YdbL family protein [Pseudomonadota bacterium]
MYKLRQLSVISLFVLISACVTINVYFPAAEVDSAAEKVVKEIMSTKDEQSSVGRDLLQLANKVNPLNWLISSASAQNDVNIDLSSAAIAGITQKMKNRFDKSLKKYLNQKNIGFTNNGFVERLDVSKLSLKERQQIKKIIADENRDRSALYREVAIANDNPQWEDKIRQAFVKQWINQAKKGWFYQNAQGQWLEK